MTIKQANQIHFTGIKGVGMTAAALCAQDLGAKVTGSDVPEAFVTQKVLDARNISIFPAFNPSNLSSGTDLVVYTGAHGGRDNPEVVAARERGISAISHAEAVGQLMEGKRGISVCGVGGKTTSSAMLAFVLEQQKLNPSYLVGVGEVAGLDFPGKYSRHGDFFIAEADEYAVDPKSDHRPRFIYQNPEIIVCTNIVYDHPDVYKNIVQTQNVFNKFFETIPYHGALVYNSDNELLQEVVSGSNYPKISIGFGPEADYRLLETKIIPGLQQVVYEVSKKEYSFSLNIPGRYNAWNALATLATANKLGLSQEEISQALSLFRGTSRRFEVKGEVEGITYVDDYAHHPSEVQSVLEAAHQWFRGRRIIAIFQPHTYSRTQKLLDEFSKSFNKAEQVVITDIFASAREEVDLSISGKLLSERIQFYNPTATYVPYPDLVEYVQSQSKPGDVVLTIGAGDIYHIHEQLLKR